MFEKIKIEFCYTTGQDKNRVFFNNNFINHDFKASVTLMKNGNFENLQLSIIPTTKITIEKLSITLPYSFKKNHRIFVNGYQSWTDSTEMCIDDKMKNISKLAAPIQNTYQLKKYGDYTFKNYSKKKGELHGYTYSYIREGQILDFLGSLSEREGFTIIEEYTRKDTIVITKECKGLSICEPYKPFKLFYANGSETEVFDQYFKAMGIGKPKCKPSTGWTSWYNYYQNISEKIILENLENFKTYNKNIDIFQIDDGYQTAVGDWLEIDKAKFTNGMRYIADSIKKGGYKAGIWLAPFICETNSKIFNEKKEWLLKDKNGYPVLAGCNWSKFYALDIYNAEVRDYIKNVFSTVIDKWGYDMVKLDFLYAVCLLPREDKTRGQIMTEAMEFLRECVGEKIILGCGVPLGPAFGLVDYCRIGCDVSLDWDDKFYMRMLHRERVSTLNSIGNAIARRQLNGRAFLNDPDVFLLRDDNISLNDSQKETLAIVNNLFGNLLFTSDNLKLYKEKQFSVFDIAMQINDRKIEQVERYKNDLVEIEYTENLKRFLILINLNNKVIMYSNNSVKQTHELPPYSSKLLEL